MDNTQYVSFIGAGQVAWHLAPALDNAGYPIREVFSRTDKNARTLVKKLYQAEVKTDLDFSHSHSSIFIISISDDHIREIAQEIILPDQGIVAHTSGTQPLSILSYTAGESIGVFYPLQTFSKGKLVNFSNIPICIEAGNKYAQAVLRQMARAISKNVVSINSNDRRSLHLAAVFACNFTNHFLKIAEDLLLKNKLDYELLQPLIAETINKSFELGPGKAQTGPAKRHDFETLDKHLHLLKKDEGLAELYRLISQHIIDSYPEE